LVNSQSESSGRHCTKCGAWKPWGEFYRGKGPNGHVGICKPCQLAYQRELRKNGGSSAYRERKLKAQKRYSDTHPEYREQQRNRWQDLRKQVLDHYGWTCGCCGSGYRPSIDHPDSDGAAHRTALFGNTRMTGAPFYKWLIDQGFPDGYQVLCLPCNQSKGNGPKCKMHSQDAHCKTCTCQSSPYS